MEAFETGLHPVGQTVGPCEGCPDPGLCMAEGECQIEMEEAMSTAPDGHAQEAWS